MSQRVAFYDWYQQVGAGERPSGGYLRKADAEILVSRLAAEPISKSVIRAFPPDSVFAPLKPKPPERAYVPKRLPAVELPGVLFVPPSTSSERDRRLLRWHWAESRKREQVFRRLGELIRLGLTA